MDLSTKDIEDYREERRAAGLNKATVDREVEVARAAFRLALKSERLPRIPFFPMFAVDNVRGGFFDPQQTEAIIRAMPDEPTKEIVRFVSLAGWRIEEVLKLSWESVDLKARQIRLGVTKNGRPRTLALSGGLLNLIERRWKAREYRTRAGSALSAFVFHRRGGRPVSYSSYRRAFVKVCGEAGVEDRTTHDFRRTVARDLRLEGIDGLHVDHRPRHAEHVPALRRDHRPNRAGGGAGGAGSTSQSGGEIQRRDVRRDRKARGVTGSL
jgi:integrase